MNSKEIKEYKKTLKLTKRQREILIGTLLGDAHLEKASNKNVCRLKIEHSIKQKDYVDWMYKEFNQWVRTEPKEKIQKVKGKEYVKYWFQTLAHASFRFYHHQFYQNGKKVIPKMINKWLTPLALAVWFMDDGSVKSKHHRARILNTQGYKKEEVEYLIQALKTIFGIEAKLRKQKEGYQIYILAETVDVFKSTAKPYIIPSMLYKLEGLD